MIYRPTGQIIWALVDGAGQDEINLKIGGNTFDLLACILVEQACLRSASGPPQDCVWPRLIRDQADTPCFKLPAKAPVLP